jgi:hypothetical protein
VHASSGALAPWFHGGVPRTEVESMLTKPAMYLIRYSEKFPVRACSPQILPGLLLIMFSLQTKLTLVYSKTKENTLQFKNCLIHNTCDDAAA